MRTVIMVITGHTQFHVKDRPGTYRCLIIDEESGKHRYLPQPELENTTPNRTLLLGAIEGLKLLKYPCKVTIYTKTSLGIKKMMKPTIKGSNGDLFAELRATIEGGNHQVEAILDVQQVDHYFRKHVFGL